jgi:hypothetical protein
VRRYRLILKYGLGDLPKAKASPTVVCPKATILLAGIQWREVICFKCPSTGSDGVSMTFPPWSPRWDRILERINAMHPPCRIAMNSVDIAAFVVNDDAEYLGDVAAIALIAGTAVAARGRAQQA